MLGLRQPKGVDGSYTSNAAKVTGWGFDLPIVTKANCSLQRSSIVAQRRQGHSTMLQIVQIAAGPIF
ncbi:hypothetical protein BV582_22675 [Bacillus paralicheniformis]|nr:hypothetical protein BV582_22675 [Bacillus paralicheniformis]